MCASRARARAPRAPHVHALPQLEGKLKKGAAVDALDEPDQRQELAAAEKAVSDAPFRQPGDLLEAMQRADALLVDGTPPKALGPDAPMAVQLNYLLYRGRTMSEVRALKDVLQQYFTAYTDVEAPGLKRVGAARAPCLAADAALLGAWCCTRSRGAARTSVPAPTPPHARAAADLGGQAVQVGGQGGGQAPAAHGPCPAGNPDEHVGVGCARTRFCCAAPVGLGASALFAAALEPPQRQLGCLLCSTASDCPLALPRPPLTWLAPR